SPRALRGDGTTDRPSPVRARRPGPAARLARGPLRFKLSFGRPKDWVDLRAIADGGAPLDLDYVEEQIVALRGIPASPGSARSSELTGPEPRSGRSGQRIAPALRTPR